MDHKTKKVAGLAGAALALSAVLPAPAGATMAPCRADARSTGSEVAIVLTGEYVDRTGSDVTLTCILVQNGVRVVSVRDPLGGPVAALASDQRLGTAPFSVCYDVVGHKMVDDFGTTYHYTNC